MNNKGFTLVEILVALFVFLMMSLIATASLYQVFQTKETLEKHLKQLSQLQIAIAILQSDLEQIIDRPILDNNGKTELRALIGNAAEIQFTRTGALNPLATLAKSHLERVGYLLVKQDLVRQSWSVLDRAPKTEVHPRILLENVSGLKIAYLTEDKKSYAFWPPSGQYMGQAMIQNPQSASSVFPKAIEIEMNIQALGQYKIMVTVNAKSLKFNKQTGQK